MTIILFNLLILLLIVNLLFYGLKKWKKLIAEQDDNNDEENNFDSPVEESKYRIPLWILLAGLFILSYLL